MTKVWGRRKPKELNRILLELGKAEVVSTTEVIRQPAPHQLSVTSGSDELLRWVAALVSGLLLSASGGNYGTAPYEISQVLLPCHHHWGYTSVRALQSAPTQFFENELSLKKGVLPFRVFKLPVLFPQTPNLLN